MIHAQDVSDLIVIYGIGAASVFLVLALMYRYALSMADEMELTMLERFDARMSMISNLLMASVPFISLVIAFLLRRSLLGRADCRVQLLSLHPRHVWFSRMGEPSKKDSGSLSESDLTCRVPSFSG